jgi:hypothetical protein
VKYYPFTGEVPYPFVRIGRFTAVNGELARFDPVESIEYIVVCTDPNDPLTATIWSCSKDPAVRAQDPNSAREFDELKAMIANAARVR